MASHRFVVVANIKESWIQVEGATSDSFCSFVSVGKHSIERCVCLVFLMQREGNELSRSSQRIVLLSRLQVLVLRATFFLKGDVNHACGGPTVLGPINCTCSLAFSPARRRRNERRLKEKDRCYRVLLPGLDKFNPLQEPGMIFQCFGEPERCPGGDPGTCARGRKS